MNDFPAGQDRFAVIGRRSFLGLAMIGVLHATGCSQSKKIDLVGTQLDSRESPDFSLTDQNGKTITLSDFRGQPVAMSFIFTNCPDICPLIAAQMRATYDLLPEDQRDEVAFLGISVDPEGDTPEAIEAFTKHFELDTVPGWHMLSGSRPELEAVWADYGIGAFAIADEVNSHLNGSAGVAAIRHTDAIYLLDSEGRQRVLLRSDVDPDDLANDLKALSS